MNRIEAVSAFILAAGCALAIDVAQAEPVVLTEDLVATNQYTAASPEGWTYNVISKLTYNGSAVTIANARCDQIRPLWAENLNWDNANNKGIAFFYHRDAHLDAEPAYVEYQAQSLNDTGLRYVFVRFQQDGDNVKVTIPVHNVSNAFTHDDAKIPPANITLGYKFGRSDNGSVAAYALNNIAYRIETDGNPNGDLALEPDLSVGYSGDYGITLKAREREDENATYTHTGELVVNNMTSYWMITNTAYNEIAPLAATVRNQGESEVRFYNWRDSGSYAEVQVQLEKEGTLNWYFLRFEQDGANVRVQAAGTGSKTLSDTFCYGYDAIKSQRTCYSTDSADSRFNLLSFTYRRRRPVEIEVPACSQGGVAYEKTLSGENTYTGMTVLDNQRLALAAGKNVLPGQQAGTTKGVVVVTNGAELVLPVTTSGQTVGGTDGLDVRLFAKGRLTVSGAYALTPRWSLFVDDAVVNVAQTSGSSVLFFGDMTLANGAWVSPATGKGVIRPNLTQTTWVSTGDSEKTNSVGDTVIIQSGCTLTCKTDAPLSLSGGVRGPSNGNGAWVKEGPSIVLYSEVDHGADLYTLKTVKLQEGTILIRDTFKTSPTTSFTLGSELTPATFACAPGTTVTLKNLDFGAKAGTIELGAGATLTVSAIDGLNEGDAPLIVKYADMDTSSLIVTPTLTPVQLAHVHFELPDGTKSYYAKQEASGRLVPETDDKMAVVASGDIYSGLSVKAYVSYPTGQTRTFKVEVVDGEGKVVGTRTETVSETGFSSFLYEFKHLPSPQTYQVRVTTSDGETTKVSQQEEVTTALTNIPLTRDLVFTNSFVQYPGAKPRKRIQLSETFGCGSYGTLKSYTIKGANVHRVRPVYARNLWKDVNSGEPIFCHRRVRNAGTADEYVEYQASTLNGGARRYAFLKFVQEGDDVVVTVANASEATSVSYPPAKNNMPGYDFRRGSLGTAGMAFAGLTFEYWDEDEVDPNGAVEFEYEALSCGYTGVYGLILKNTLEEDETQAQTTPCEIYNNRLLDCSLVITNALYNKIDIVSATGNSYFGEGEVKFYHWRDHGVYAEVQAQLEDETKKKLNWMFVRLQQDGANVVVKIFGENESTSPAWTAKPEVRYGYDCLQERRMNWIDGGTPPRAAARGLTSLTYYRRRPVSEDAYQYYDHHWNGDVPTTPYLSGVNTYSGPTVVDGLDLVLTNRANVLAGGNVMVVTNGATLFFQASTGGQMPGGSSKGLDIRAYAGGTVVCEGDYAANYRYMYLLDNARLYFPQSSGASQITVKDITLANGATVFPLSAYGEYRILGDQNGGLMWHSIGDPCKTNVVVGRYVTVNGEDCTFDIQAPAFFQGGIFPGNNKGTYTKNGASTLIYSQKNKRIASVSNTLKAWVINEGAFYVCDELRSPESLTLGSSATPATFACAAMTTNTLTAVNLATAGNLIDLGKGAQLTIDALGTWADGDTLLVKYADRRSSSLIFTPTLTPKQLARIRLMLPNGEICSVMQTASGRIAPVNGLILVVW